MMLTAETIIRQEEMTVALMEDQVKAELKQAEYHWSCGNVSAAAYHASKADQCDACAHIARQKIAAIREAMAREEVHA
jgi:hypothetical protein